MYHLHTSVLTKTVNSIICKYRGLNKSRNKPGGTEKLNTFMISSLDFPKPKPRSQNAFDSLMSMCMPAIVDNANASIQSSRSVTDSLSAELTLTKKELGSTRRQSMDYQQESQRHEDKMKLDNIARRQNTHIEALKGDVMDPRMRLKQQLAATQNVENKTEKLQDVLKRK